MPHFTRRRSILQQDCADTQLFFDVEVAQTRLIKSLDEVHVNKQKTERSGRIMQGPALRTDDSIRHASVLRATSVRHMAPTSSGPRKVRTNHLATEKRADPDIRRLYQTRLLESLPNAPPSDVNGYWNEIATSLQSVGNFACGEAPPAARKHWISNQTVSLLKSRRNIPVDREHNPGFTLHRLRRLGHALRRPFDRLPRGILFTQPREGACVRLVVPRHRQNSQHFAKRWQSRSSIRSHLMVEHLEETLEDESGSKYYWPEGCYSWKIFVISTTAQIKNDVTTAVVEDVDLHIKRTFWTVLSVKNCFIRGSIVRYVQLPADECDTVELQNASRKEATLGKQVAA
ncbi:U6 snRNA-associated Sm-like protein LSm2 [Clonorchis sinensis]|uniref:U6 snRNA-associated Sm-like protein LSm2 n=1 Tax=Clonorchis sinensis TaxID=79923 RepID=G7YBT2_CLOSI|nr:U6 snRNA-associated Sm-like protein LSm2 [Clonorchis sinensis]